MPVPSFGQALASSRNNLPLNSPELDGLGDCQLAPPYAAVPPSTMMGHLPSYPGQAWEIVLEAFLMLTEATGSDQVVGCPLISGLLGFPSLRASYQATASKEGSALAPGWHSSGCSAQQGGELSNSQGHGHGQEACPPAPGRGECDASETPCHL